MMGIERNGNQKNSNLSEIFSLVEDRHKKRGFLIRPKHGSIHTHRKAKLSNSHKVIFFLT